MIKILNNYVLVFPDYEHFDSVDIGGAKLDLNVNFEKEIHYPSSGIVMKAPHILNYTHIPEDREALLFETDMEVMEGDRVIFGYNLVPQAITHGKCFGGAVYIKYDELYCAIRGSEIIMLNGYVMVESVEDFNPSGDIIVPAHLQSVNHFQRGRILHIGSPVRKYRMYPEIGGDAIGQMAAGDHVLFHMQYSIPLQYQMHSVVNQNKEIYRMQQKDISAVFEQEKAA